MTPIFKGSNFGSITMSILPIYSKIWISQRKCPPNFLLKTLCIHSAKAGHNYAMSSCIMKTWPRLKTPSRNKPSNAPEQIYRERSQYGMTLNTRTHTHTRLPPWWTLLSSCKQPCNIQQLLGLMRTLRWFCVLAAGAVVGRDVCAHVLPIGPRPLTSGRRGPQSALMYRCSSMENINRCPHTQAS